MGISPICESLSGCSVCGNLPTVLWLQDTGVVLAQVMDWVTSNSAVKTTITGEPDELAIAARLKHPNIVAVYASTTKAIETVLATHGKESSQAMQSWLIMDYCDKGSLIEAIDKGWFQTRTSKVSM